MKADSLSMTNQAELWIISSPSSNTYCAASTHTCRRRADEQSSLCAHGAHDALLVMMENIYNQLFCVNMKTGENLNLAT